MHKLSHFLKIEMHLHKATVLLTILLLPFRFFGESPEIILYGLIALGTQNVFSFLYHLKRRIKYKKFSSRGYGTVLLILGFISIYAFLIQEEFGLTIIFLFILLLASPLMAIAYYIITLEDYRQIKDKKASEVG